MEGMKEKLEAQRGAFVIQVGILFTSCSGLSRTGHRRQLDHHTPPDARWEIIFTPIIISNDDVRALKR